MIPAPFEQVVEVGHGVADVREALGDPDLLALGRQLGLAERLLAGIEVRLGRLLVAGLEGVAEGLSSPWATAALSCTSRDDLSRPVASQYSQAPAAIRITTTTARTVHRIQRRRLGFARRREPPLPVSGARVAVDVKGNQSK